MQGSFFMPCFVWFIACKVAKDAKEFFLRLGDCKTMRQQELVFGEGRRVKVKVERLKFFL